ncbi:SUMF1/EgtB/PvdO family nonheme iron enzyme [Acetomicrobium sp.]|uniref:SUMF1/EgtB/PvdO family nonheme iron enzyme n=1 Tax=Acetomicrobium sp. TaxID=1872099 RepID=UPI001BD02A3E
MNKTLLIVIMVIFSASMVAIETNGYLSVKSADGVEILVDGKLAGVVKDGQLFLELAAGTYEITAQGYGFTSKTIRNVKIEPLRATTLEISLKKYNVVSDQLSGKLQIDLIRKYGTVRVFSIPFNGAQVTINGESCGETDIELSYFPAGQLSVEVEGPDRSKVNGIFFLDENKILTLLADFIDKKIYQLYDESVQEKIMVLVEGGTFTMGDTWGGGENDEKPTHKVTFTYDFYIGKYETTFDEYDAFCSATGKSKPNDQGWGRGQRPVISVSWWDAIAYCNWLSEKEKLPKAYDNNGNLLDKDGKVTTDPSKVVGYRLPTEAEWEYAARGGNKSKGYKYSGSDNVGDVAWYDSNSQSKTHEVGTKAPNELGLYDMSGNVYEWCSDWYGGYSSSAQTNPYKSTVSYLGSARVGRGGGWDSIATNALVARRHTISPAGTYDCLGFRICRTVP